MTTAEFLPVFGHRIKDQCVCPDNCSCRISSSTFG